jgi:hypothetical protein
MFKKYIIFIFNIIILTNFVLGAEQKLSQQQCSEYVIKKFIDDFSKSDNLCNFCKSGAKILNIISAVCTFLPREDVNKDLGRDTLDFLNDFVRTGGSCESVCDCIDPKPMKCPTFGKCCDGCVCAEIVVGDGQDGYSSTIKEGCSWGQYWNDWSRLTTQKCTTKTFN